MRRTGWACALALALGFISVAGVGAALSHPVLHAVGDVPADLPAKSVRLRTADGAPIGGWLVHGMPGAGAVLLLHGVRGDRRNMLGRARFLARLGYSVLLIDLPAHGESVADHITFGFNEAQGVKAALDDLRRELPGERIGVVGVSLGAAALVLAAPEPAPAAVVLESMYPTVEEAVADRLRLHLGTLGETLAPLLLLQLPWRLGISAAQLRPIDRLPALHAPVLIASGALDRHTTLAETERIYSVAGAPKELWIVDGAAHVDLHAFDRVGYESKVAAFLARYLHEPQ